MRIVALLVVIPAMFACRYDRLPDLADASSADASVDADSRPPNTVVGRRYTKCINGSTQVEVPIDLSSTVLQAWIPDQNAASGYTVVDGVGKADGTFTVSNVPDGSHYFLRLGTSYSFKTSHVDELYGELYRRCVPAPEPLATNATVNLSLSNMQPNASSAMDTVILTSFALALSESSIAFIPQNTTMYMASRNWSSLVNFFGEAVTLPQAQHGDDIEVLHYRDDVVLDSASRAQGFSHLVDRFTTTSVTLSDGGSADINGAFSPVPANKSVTMTFSRAVYDNAFDGTTAVSTGPSVTFSAGPNELSMTAELAQVTFRDWRKQATSSTVTLMYPDPFPIEWRRGVVVSYPRRRSIKIPGATNAGTNTGSMSKVFTYSGASLNLQPSVFPPGGLKVADLDFSLGGLVRFDGVKPVEVKWNAVSSATRYSLSVRRVLVSGSSTSIQQNATFSTTATSIAIPAGVFVGSEYFVFLLTAFGSDGTAFGSARVPSGLFRFSANCGNGTVDLGEACDSSGTDTAACNSICTAPTCGDGHWNAAAGEQCDTIVNTRGCDSNCTLPMCGDGFVNPELEDCDPPGTNCSSSCKNFQ